MSAPETPTEGTSWALSTLDAVPAARHQDDAGTRGAGRHPILTWAADIATRIHQSWRRRDIVWVALPILLAVLCAPH